MRSLLFGFEGRIDRTAFWAVQIPIMGLGWVYQEHMDRLLAQWFPYSVFAGSACALVIIAPLVWVQYAITIKRCHDRGKSGFWSLLLLVPLIGEIWLLIDCGLLSSAKASVPTGSRSAP